MVSAARQQIQFGQPRQSVVNWLLESDPSIRWQVMRDITKEPAEAVESERSRVATEGWGARLLSEQASDGRWWADTDSWPCKGTIFALVLLKDLGLEPASELARKAINRVRERVTLPHLGDLPLFEGETEPCINGRILATGAYFGVVSERLVDRLLGEQLNDGGWNCEAPKSQRSSFHSTICVLEGLLGYERANGANASVTKARLRALEYMLERRMFRRLSSGSVIDRSWTMFAFPPTYHYDALRGLDYMRGAGVKPDERMSEAVALVAKRQHQNGRWPLNIEHSDRVPFDMEAGKGKASRWNTLRALRVLDWYSDGFRT